MTSSKEAQASAERGTNCGTDALRTPRRALFARLDAAFGDGARAVCLTAPAGYGKTASIGLWLKERAALYPAPVRVTLDPYDDSAALFCRRLCAALANAHPNCAALRETMQDPTFPSAPVEFLAEALIDLDGVFAVEEAEGTAPRMLVLDDVHHLKGDDVVSALPHLLKRLPEAYRVLLLGRGGPALRRVASALGEAVAWVGPENLRFSLEEIRDCYRAAGTTLSEEEARAVQSVTDGWPVAVAALAHAGEALPDADRAEIMERYIATHLWTLLDRPTQDFLLRTCIVGELRPVLAARLAGTGVAEAERTLEEIASQSLLTDPTGPSGPHDPAAGQSAYVHHQLFRDFLLRRLEEEAQAGKVDVPALHDIASTYFQGQEENHRAIYHALRGSDRARTASALHELLRYDNRNSSVAEHVDRLGFSLDALSPQTMQAHPYLHVSYAWHAYLTGNASKMLCHLDALYEVLPQIEAEFPDFWEPCLLVCTLDHRRPIAEAVRRFQHTTLDEVAARDLQATSITQNLPYMHKSVRDLAELAVDPAEMAAYQEAFSVILTGDYDIIRTAVQAGLQFEQDRLDTAWELATQAATTLYDASSRVPELGFAARMIRADVADAQERREEADRLYADTRAYLLEMNARYLLPNFAACETKRRLQDGEAAAAEAWLENYFVDVFDLPGMPLRPADTAVGRRGRPRRPAASIATQRGREKQLELFRIAQHLTTARALIVRAPLEAARAFISRLLRLADDFGRVTDGAETLILRAILEWQRGDREEALSALSQAASRVSPYGYVRLFADEGAALLEPLSALIARSEGEQARVLRKIRLAAATRAKHHPGISHAVLGGPVKLSEKQRAVLSALAQGYRREEVAERAGVKLSTVKTHAALAYKKLEADSLAEAVTKARALGLLDG